uniref:Uncharacterized protein n=1 Tax=Klebsiella pneumoniae TaxID=573 RepID=A0A8B0SVC2_KLEPN|nr:hypothetical protein [Klebsiella pneumoniae]
MIFDGTLTRHDSFIPFSAVCLWQSGVFRDVSSAWLYPRYAVCVSR